MRILKQNTNVNRIFFWQQTKHLPCYFDTLAKMLSQLNIELYPVNLEDLMHSKQSKKVHLMVLRNDLSSAREFNELRRNYIESSMASGRVMIYDVSSFSKLENTTSRSKKISYKFFELPIKVETLGVMIASEFYNDKNAEEENNQKDSWTKLPSLRMTN